MRTHTCYELTISDNKKEATLIGWAQRIRDHGGKKFIDLRDREGITQLVFDPDVTKDFEGVENFRRESVIQINGTVRPRPEGTINKKHKTGEVEVLVKSFEVINECDVLPFDIDAEHFKDVNEDLRLEYRYLDLRRTDMLSTFKNRHKFFMAIRNFLDTKDFIDVETPLLTKSTPEGARDLLVPARKHEGHFYALPQSPQLFKQLLMVAGFEKYYQIARCFRDEDSRKDRQLEFTQLDMEVSFREFEEFKEEMQELLIAAVNVYDKKITKDNFSVLSYHEAMDKFGSDKPDLRIQGLELVDMSEIASKCGFSVFSGTIERGGLVKAICVKGGQEKLSRKDIDKLIVFCQEQGAKGMAWMKVIEDNTSQIQSDSEGLGISNSLKIESSITKFFKEEELEEIRKSLGGETGDYLFFIADEKETTNNVLDGLRRKLAQDLELMTDKESFVWIVDFPLFKYNEEEKRIDAEHSPFSMPNPEGIKFIEENITTKEDIEKHKDGLLKLKADCYDISFNGIEIASGALRIHKPKLQKKIFEIIEMSEETIEAQFGWFLKAYNYGAPSHRGIAFGLDRMIMLLEDAKSIRDVMPFPKNKAMYCPLTKSPSTVDENQLKELHIKLEEKKKEK